jgi:hypothetical protein
MGLFGYWVLKKMLNVNLLLWITIKNEQPNFTITGNAHF